MVKLNLIAAVSENMGIGKNNDLPWRLKSEMAYFTHMTTKRKDESKMNVVIMGRKTWDSLPKKFKPLHNRINFILSRSELNFRNFKDVYGFKSLDQCIGQLEDKEFKKKYENVWVIGGSQIYMEALKSDSFYRLYLTRILTTCDCDTFFPDLPTNLKEIRDPDVAEEIQNENGIEFVYKVYENKH